LVLQTIAGTLAATQPDAAAIILGAAEVYPVAPSHPPQLVSASVTAALGEEHNRDLLARCMDWDQAIAYTLAQTTQALKNSNPEPGHEPESPLVRTRRLLAVYSSWVCPGG
jgi:hypothetical protein